MAAEKALGKPAELEAEARAVVLDVYRKMVKRVAGMYAEPWDPEYNADGERSRKDCPMRTVAAVEVMKAGMAARAGGGGPSISLTINLPAKEAAKEYVDVVIVEKSGADD